MEFAIVLILLIGGVLGDGEISPARTELNRLHEDFSDLTTCEAARTLEHSELRRTRKWLADCWNQVDSQRYQMEMIARQMSTSKASASLCYEAHLRRTDPLRNGAEHPLKDGARCREDRLVDILQRSWLTKELNECEAIAKTNTDLRDLYMREVNEEFRNALTCTVNVATHWNPPTASNDGEVAATDSTVE